MAVNTDGLAYCANDIVWSERVEEASSVSLRTNTWLQTDMILNADRFKHWGITPEGAIRQVNWLWDPALGSPPATDTPNHRSAVIHAVKLGKQLDEAETMNMVEYYDPHKHGSKANFAHNILPLGAREKSTGAVRMLVDPSLPGVNSHMLALPCELPTIEQVFQHVKPHSVLGKRDLANGFFHIVLAPEARRHMCFRHPTTRRLGRWVVLPQGTKQSPAIFCAVSNAAAAIFNRIFEQQNIHAIVLVYVDDFIIIADTHADMVKAFDAMDTEAALLGLKFNPDKDKGKDEPLTCIEALGIIIDAPKQELRLPTDKRTRYTHELQAFTTAYKNKPTAPRKTVESLTGKLLYACRVCRWGYLFVQSILDELYPVTATTQQPKQIPLTEAVWADLQFWQQVLDKDSGMWLGVKKHMLGTKELHVKPDNFQTHIYTDASKRYGAGGIMGTEVFSQQWEENKHDVHIGTLELEALRRTLHHWKHDLAQQTVLAWMDNMQAVSAVNKGASRKPALRPILLDIALLGIQHGFELKARHIKGELNPADAPSRGAQRSTSSDWTFAYFEQFNNPPAEVDCCAAASGYNVQPGCTEWFSAVKPVQQHVEQLVGKTLWANIPFNQLDPIMDAIVTAWQRDPVSTVATVVVPEWPEANWFRKYLRRKRPLFTVLHRYPAGSQVFRWKNSKALAPPTRHAILVLRLGSARDTNYPVKRSKHDH